MDTLGWNMKELNNEILKRVGCVNTDCLDYTDTVLCTKYVCPWSVCTKYRLPQQPSSTPEPEVLINMQDTYTDSRPDTKSIQILCTDGDKLNYPVVALWTSVRNEFTIESYTANGKYIVNGDPNKSDIKLVTTRNENNVLDFLKTGAVVMVRNHDGAPWRKRRFSHRDGAKFYAFDYMSIKRTRVTAWKQCRLPTARERMS